MKGIFFSMPDKYRQIVFCILLVLCIVFPLKTAPAWMLYFNAPAVLLIGIVVAFTVGSPFKTAKKTTLLLQISVVCLGFHLDIHNALAIGKQGLIFTACSIFFTLLTGYLIGKVLKIDEKTAFLISSGTAICGGSAIAAVAPIVKANEYEIGVALGTIFIFNSLALILFPPLGHYFQLSAEQFGTWCAIAIHDTSSVVGAAASYKDTLGRDALAIATTIKLERALWIIPISFATVCYCSIEQKEMGKGKVKIPYFIFCFVLAIIISSYFPINWKIDGKNPYDYIYLFGRKGLIITLFLIGSAFSISTIKLVGFKPILQGFLLWALVAGLSLIVIKNVIV